MRALTILVAAAFVPGLAAAQDFNGAWSLPTGNGGQLVLTLSQQGRNVTGSLSGNGTTLVFQGEARQGQLTGIASNGAAGLHLSGRVQGTGLDVTLSELDAAGQPVAAQSQRVTMNRVGQAAAAADSGQRRPGLLQRIGSALSEAARQQQQGQAQPGAQNAQGAQGAQGAQPAGAIASTPQDQQIAQLLTSSRWCSFRYSQISGTTSTERVTFTPDGRFVMGSNRESSSSNQYGSVYGSSSGGDRGQWRVQNGVLMMSANGIQWEQYPIRITQNSNGYPIVHANQKEYSQCN